MTPFEFVVLRLLNSLKISLKYFIMISENKINDLLQVEN